jgi:hypothetical protein
MKSRCIDALALQRILREVKPIVYEEDNGYDQGALDMWNLLYAAVKAAPTIKEDSHGKE